MNVHALLSLGPNVEAFTSGVVLVLSVTFLILVAVGGLSVFRRIVGA
jgi:hypothetical protein